MARIYDELFEYLANDGLRPEKTDFGIYFRYNMCSFAIFWEFVGGDGGESNDIIPCVPRNVRNYDVVAAVANVDSVLIFHIAAKTVNNLGHASIKINFFDSSF